MSVLNTLPPDDLTWNAWRYWSEEMSEVERERFEEQLAVDQSAREALSQAVLLSSALQTSVVAGVLAAVPSPEVARATVAPVMALTAGPFAVHGSSSGTSFAYTGRGGSVSSLRSRFATWSAMLLLFAATWIGANPRSAERAPDVVRLAPGTGEFETAESEPDARELVSQWSESVAQVPSADETDAVDDELESFSPHDLAPVRDVAIPGWMVAALAVNSPAEMEESDE